MRQYDFSPLDQPVKFADVMAVSGVRFQMIITGVFALTMMIIVGATALANTGIGASQNSVWVIWAWLALPLLVTVFVIIGIRNGASRTVRVQRFASVNNLSYTTSLRDPTYKGMIFQFGRDRCIREELTIDTSSGNGAQIGTYQCVTGSGRSQHTHRFSYIRYTLSR